jgi:hypothetical protein
MTLLLDTAVLIDALRRRNGALALLAETVDLGHQLGTSAISVAEVFSGSRLAEEPTTQAFLESIFCFPVTFTIADLGGSSGTSGLAWAERWAWRTRSSPQRRWNAGYPWLRSIAKTFPYPSSPPTPSPDPRRSIRPTA